MIRQERLVLIISVLASFVAFLDGSVVNVALPAISRDLGGGLSIQQWTVDAYLIALGSFILLAGSLSDLFGRKRILAFGLIGFALTSLMCALAPSGISLIAARGIQGAAGALLVPSSLALIISSFTGSSQGRAIGRWTAWTGIAFIIGPLLGGFLVDALSWRLIFAINLLPITLCLWALRRLEEPAYVSHTSIDAIGAILCSLGLCAGVFGLIEQPHFGWHSPFVLVPLLGGVALTATFVWYENRTQRPMLPLEMFRVRNFLVGNIATAAMYGGLSIATFLIVIFLQQVSGYSALAAGLALLPVTIIMFILSPRFGTLAGRYGPRFFMALGPSIAGIGFLLMLRMSAHGVYWSELLPGVLVFALGLSMTVAPLTAAVLSDVPRAHAGIASAVNNAIARIAGLLSIAAVGVVVGAHLDVQGFRRAIILTAALAIAGGIISAFGIRNRTARSLGQTTAVTLK